MQLIEVGMRPQQAWANHARPGSPTEYTLLSLSGPGMIISLGIQVTTAITLSGTGNDPIIYFTYTADGWPTPFGIQIYNFTSGSSFYGTAKARCDAIGGTGASVGDFLVTPLRLAFASSVLIKASFQDNYTGGAFDFQVNYATRIT